MQRDIIRLLKNSNFAFLREIIGEKYISEEVSLIVNQHLSLHHTSCILLYQCHICCKISYAMFFRL